MKPVKKVLVLHADAKIRRRLVLLLADAGLDVRSFPDVASATGQVRGEWFDLAVMENDLTGGAGNTPVDQLRRLQPTLPILLAVPRIELPLVVQGIRMGVADVVALGGDPAVLLRRVLAMLGLDPAADGAGVTSSDLAQVEAALANLPVNPEAGPGSAADTAPDILRLSKENAALAARVERLGREKAGLEAELRTLIAQGVDAQRLESQLAELKTERELASATQSAIDEKARSLSEMRAAIAAERTELEKARRAAAGSSGNGADEARVDAQRRRLEEEEDRLAGETARLRQETAQLAQERRRWHDDLDLLRAQEQNLRDYEARLRQIQAQLESDRVLWFSTQSRPAPPSPFVNDAALKEAWTKLQRATELLEAERTNFKDDRLAVAERESHVKRREAEVRDKEIKLALQEKMLKSLPPPKPKLPGMGVAKLVLGRR